MPGGKVVEKWWKIKWKHYDLLAVGSAAAVTVAIVRYWPRIFDINLLKLILNLVFFLRSFSSLFLLLRLISFFLFFLFSLNRRNEWKKSPEYDGIRPPVHTTSETTTATMKTPEKESLPHKSKWLDAYACFNSVCARQPATYSPCDTHSVSFIQNVNEKVSAEVRTFVFWYSVFRILPGTPWTRSRCLLPLYAHCGFSAAIVK